MHQAELADRPYWAAAVDHKLELAGLGNYTVAAVLAEAAVQMQAALVLRVLSFLNGDL
jgi:hypothetical protein